MSNPKLIKNEQKSLFTIKGKFVVFGLIFAEIINSFMVFFPNIKINLGLKITGKRPDGYHNLESVFYPLGWTDALEILPSDIFKFTMTGMEVEGDLEKNLVVKAFRLLQRKYNLSSVNIHLHKAIPTGAGVGGGSADAAYTIRLLNELFRLRLGESEMEDLSAQLGSDCPFFIKNKPAYVTGRGEFIEPIALDLSKYYFAVVHPGIHVSTAEAFAGVKPVQAEVSLREIIQKPVKEWKEIIVNDFEKSIFPKFPEIQKLKEEMYEQGAVYASMSGSGSAVYGIFEKPVELKFIEKYKSWSDFNK